MRHVRVTILAIALFLLCPLTWATSITSFGSPAEPVVLGSSFTLPVQISGVSNLYGYAFDVSFDPSVLQLTSIMEGSFLSSGGLTDFAPGLIDNANGLAVFTASLILEPTLGASGSGSLANFNFLARGSGSSNVSIVNMVLLDSNFAEIASLTTPTVVAVGVPEPATYLMVLLSLGVVTLCCARKFSHSTL